MNIFTVILMLAVAFLFGCSTERFRSGRGNVGEFILQHATARGGSPVTNALPIIGGKWRYSEDKDGVVIRMHRDQYQEVENFLRLAFGEPKISSTAETVDGSKLGVYRLSDKGGAVQFVQDARQTQVIVLRPMSTEETFDKALKGLKQMEKPR